MITTEKHRKKFEPHFIWLSQFLFYVSYSFCYFFLSLGAFLCMALLLRSVVSPNEHIRSLLLFLCIFFVVVWGHKISIECLVRADKKSDELSRFRWNSIDIHDPRIKSLCHTNRKWRFYPLSENSSSIRNVVNKMLFKRSGKFPTINLKWSKGSANLLIRDVCLIDIYYNYSVSLIRHLLCFFCMIFLCVYACHNQDEPSPIEHEIVVYYFIHLPPSGNHWVIEFVEFIAIANEFNAIHLEKSEINVENRF